MTNHTQDKAVSASSEVESNAPFESDGRQTTLNSWLVVSDDHGSTVSKRKRASSDAIHNIGGSDRAAKRVRGNLVSDGAADLRASEPKDSQERAGLPNEEDDGVRQSVLDTSISDRNKVLPDRNSEDGILAEDHDPDDPITWDWQSLFQVYVFGDKYDTKHFRKCIIEVIQLKVLQKMPRGYVNPAVSDFTYAFGVLPAASPLYKFLVDVLVYFIHPGDDVSESSALPPEVLSAIWINAKRLEAFHACRICYGRDHVLQKICQCLEGSECDACRPCGSARHRGVVTALPPYVRDMHQCHEHETDGEKYLCEKRWVADTE